MHHSWEDSRAGFGETRWSLLRAMHEGDDTVRQQAAEELVRIYWPAVYGWLRRHGRGQEEASEITQAFFSDVVIGRDLFGSADAQKGRLQSLLLSALKRYEIDCYRRAAARRRSAHVSLDAIQREEALLARQDGIAPDDMFDRRWAAAALEEALRRAEQHFLATSRESHWRLFEARILEPARSGCEPRPLKELAESLDIASAADAAAAVQVVKKRVDALLREVCGELVQGSEDLDGEVRWVARALGPRADG